MPITVSNTTELYAAMATCKGGETILLEGGQYGSLNINTYMKPPVNIDFPSTVTIASADPSDPAVFSSADVRDASNLTIEGVTFDYTFKPGDAQSLTPFVFSYNDGLTIRNCTFDGDEAYGAASYANGYGTGIGLRVRGSTNTVVEGNESYNFYKGMTFDDNEDTIVRGNELHSMRMDGMTFMEMNGVLIEDNYIHDFRGSPTSGDHCDMIQFFTSGTDEPSVDVVIRDNVLDIGDGTFTQSIFMNNEVVSANPASFGSMAYRNVSIQGNTITNAHQWGIYVGETAGLSIRGNTVKHSDGDKPDGADHPVEIPLINVASKSTGVTITQNVTSAITGHTGQTGWTVRNNTFVQDQNPRAPGYYADASATSSLQSGASGSDQHAALAESETALPEADSEATQPEGLQVLFRVEGADEATRLFDAGPSRLDGADMPPGTAYAWSFGDGTAASGRTVSHSYADGGDYEPTLTATLPGGAQGTKGAAVAVEGPEVVTMDALGQFTAYEHGKPIALGAGPAATGDGLQLGASGTSATVARSHVSDVVGTDDMTIAFTLDADRAGSAGELFQLHGSFAVSVTTSGELQVEIMRDGAATVSLTTKGAGLNAAAGREHDVVVNLADSQLQVWVDGELGGQVAVPGVVGGATGFGSHDLVFGNPSGRANFSGDLSAFELSVRAGDYPATPETIVLDAGSSAALDPSDALMPAAQDDLGGQQGAEASQDDLLDGAHDRFATMLQEPLDAYAA